jgi:hypothetical protein
MQGQLEISSSKGIRAQSLADKSSITSKNDTQARKRKEKLIQSRRKRDDVHM